MPTLFDSHEEFNEWFSKDIESHAENKSAIDESQSTQLSQFCSLSIISPGSFKYVSGLKNLVKIIR